MQGFKGERTLMRIHVGEADLDAESGKRLYHRLVDLFRERGFAGCTVFRGMLGFGASARMRTNAIEVLSFDMPVVIECVETEERIAAILPELDALTGGGLITLERVKVIMYRPDLTGRDRTPADEIDVDTSWASGALES